MTIKRSANSENASEVNLQWVPTDSLLLGILAGAALVTRFWRLGYPAEPVFDEIQFVGQAFAFLRGEQFLDVHPNLPKLLIAGAIELLGHHPWVWRVSSAVLGTSLVLITFLLGREMFRSRLAAALSAMFVLCDGMFLIHSRLAMLEIFHVTFTSASYLLLFQFLRTRDPAAARRKILYLGLISGAALASKLVLPEIAFLLVSGFSIYGIISRSPGIHVTDRRIIGTLVLLLSVSSAVYFLSFMPNYWLGWWGGAWSLFHYYHEVLWNLGQMSLTTNPFVSPWWSWPLMLRAPLYWHGQADGEMTTVIWAGGNPILWWTSLCALVITIVREIRSPTVSRSFLLIGYFSYIGALSVSRHPFFLYIYMTPLYLQYLMLAALLANCWNGRCHWWEQVLLLVSLSPGCLLGFGTMTGSFCLVGIAAVYVILAWRFRVEAKFAGALVVAAALAAFVFFLPVWLGQPLDPAAYNARIWLQGPGVAKWM